jgi:hypothetical protein
MAIAPSLLIRKKLVFVYRVSWNVILSGAKNLYAGQHRVPVVAEILRKKRSENDTLVNNYKNYTMRFLHNS